MKVSLKTTLLVLLLTLLSITATARTVDDNDEPDDYDVKARVVRVSLITGEANLKRNDSRDWERARLNFPLVEGDTIATEKDSRMEIQIDARNFVRLAPATVLRIVTLRDEGIALSVVEGTAVVRLVKFDRSHEYFEVDAPKTTMAAEKPGMYRIDVPRDGRVRLTVREGGTARIYSDTSGFTLRDGRSAEFIATGENAGDWNFIAASLDETDDWVSERERYLAQRLRYNSEYYDEYVWGAEELAAYGDWVYTSDFGWIWRPFPNVISVYGDWAPYRYGRWVWCPPYGWTWVGYEPWGWAPYHYGRWVYYNNAWVWIPRSQFTKKRSWWRPALVAFVSLDFSFGNDICWYPLSYYQRDPHSRYYRRHDRPGSGYAGGGHSPGHRGQYPGAQNPGGQNPGRDRDYKPWRGVTHVPRSEFGNGDDRSGRPADERTARRVFETEPQVVDLPRRSGVASVGPRTIQVPDSPTGAAERTPGAALDEDLRRSRVFRGREPRATEPVQTRTSAPAQTSTSVPAQTSTAPAETSTTPAQEASPSSGAVARPEPRMVRPAMPEGVEKRARDREGIERGAQRETEKPRIETPSESPRSAPPRSESPRAESRPEPRSEPAPRSEAPRSESPRSESPRSESPRSESPRSESPRSESPRSESPRSESPRSESPRSESPKKPDNPIR